MIRHWMASAVLSLALAGQASAQTPANGAGRTPDDPGSGMGTESDAGTMSPGATGEGVDRSTGTTGVDRSTGAPSGLQDPSRRGTRTRPVKPGTENGTEPGTDEGTGKGAEGGTTKPPLPPTPMP